MTISGIMVDGVANLCGLFPKYREYPDKTLKEKNEENIMAAFTKGTLRN